MFVSRSRELDRELTQRAVNKRGGFGLVGGLDVDGASCLWKNLYYTKCPSEQKNERVLKNIPVEMFLNYVESTLPVAASRMRAQPRPICGT
jgi:hypothetical protein